MPQHTRTSKPKKYEKEDAKKKGPKPYNRGKKVFKGKANGIDEFDMYYE